MRKLTMSLWAMVQGDRPRNAAAGRASNGRSLSLATSPASIPSWLPT